MMMQYLNLFLVILSLSQVSQAQVEWVADIRENEGAASNYCQQAGGHCQPLRSHTTEFSNGNTFVQVESPVANLNTRLLLPKDLSADGFIEALIKVRTFKTEGAREVIVEFPDPSRFSSTPTVPFELWDLYLKTAGADTVIFHDLPQHPMTAPSFLFGDGIPKPIADTVVTDFGNPKLTTSFSEGLGSQIMSYEALLESSKSYQVFLLSSSSNATNQHFLETLTRAMKLRGAGHEVILVFPYFPYSRSDKVDQPGVTATAKLIADLVEVVKVKGVIASRLHAPQVQGFFNVPFVHVSGRKTIDDYLLERRIDAVVSPDAGFQKEASLYADRMDVPVFVLNKQRDPRTGESRLLMMGDFDLSGLRLAVIDDETASGGTLGSAAEFLKTQANAEFVVGAVTHLAGLANKALESPFLDRVVVTNTFPVELTGESAVVLDIGAELGVKARKLSVAALRESGPGCQPLLENGNE